MPYCCVPATLQWVLYRNGIDILDQETIGAELGLRLPTRGREFFTNKNIKYLTKEPIAGFGTQIEKGEYSIEKFLTKHKIPLTISKLIIIDQKQELKRFLCKQFKQNHDTILCYNNKELKRVGAKNCGHFSVISEFDEVLDIVIIGDPDLPHFKSATLDQLLYATSIKIDGIQRGFYIIQKTSEK